MNSIEIISKSENIPFTIGERIGSGGFGLIYKVKGSFKTPAVIKIGDNDQLINEYSMYNILSNIIPANIPKCYMFGYCNVNGEKQTFIIIEFIEYTLCEGDNSLDKQFSSNAEIILIYMNIFNELVDILYKIHQHGFIHKDIKPSNILIKQVNGVYIPVLIDFGLIDTIININGEQIYFAGTRCYSSIYQHFGLSAVPIDDYINLVYTWMRVISMITKSNKLPWDTSVVRQDKKKHEFYAYEKWTYLTKYDPNNFFDKVLNYLYSLQHYWTSIIDLKKLYYIDPLQKYSFDIHTIELHKQWNKFIKQESLTIDKQPYLNPHMVPIAKVDDIIIWIKRRLNNETPIKISDFTLTFMRYMIKQYNNLTNMLWSNLTNITEEFVKKSPDSKIYLYSWLENIQKALRKDNKVFDNMISSIDVYKNCDIYSFFNYKRCQAILKTAMNKLPKVEKTYSLDMAGDYVVFFNKLINIYKRIE